jgi:hypothetical protein
LEDLEERNIRFAWSVVQHDIALYWEIGNQE